MPTRNLIISNLWQLVTADTNNLPTKVKNTYIPPPTIDGSSLGGVKQGANITIAADGTISSTGGGGGVSSVTVGTTLSTALLFATSTTTPVLNSQNVGAAPLTVFLRGDGTWAVPPSGGGGGSFTATSIWSSGTANKNAQISPGVINNQGITISLAASSGSGQITAATVSLNGVALTNLYASTGTFPNLTIVIPVADITGNAAQTAPTVAISLVGTYGGSGVSVANAGTLTNNQPIPFATTLSGSYAVSTTPFYITTGQLNYSYTNAGAITTFAGVFTPPGGTAGAATGFFPGIALTGSTISGSATGSGARGAGTTTVNLSGAVPAVPSYIPAFYAQPASGSTPPVFATNSLQTTGAALGSVITYSVSSAQAFYGWIAIPNTLALSNIYVRTVLGDSVLVPDITAPNQTVAGQVYLVFGFTRFDITTPVTLVIK